MNKHKGLLNILTVLFVLMLALGGYKVFQYIRDKNLSDRSIEDMIMVAVTANGTGNPEFPDEMETPEAPPISGSQPKPLSTVTPDATVQSTTEQIAARNEVPSPSPKIIRPQLDILEQAPIRVDFEKLLSINSDIAGWIYCEDVMSEPVVWAADNKYYLEHAPDRSSNVNGTVFLDCGMEKDLSDKNLLIFGHNMRNGVRFGKLAMFKQQENYDEHKVIYLLTPQGDFAIELIAGCVVAIDSEYYTQPDTDEEMAERIARAKSESTFDSIVDFENGDTIVTLSTCSNEIRNARYLVMGRLVPLGTEEPVPTKKRALP